MTNAQMIQKNNITKFDKLYIAFELSNTKWKLLSGNGFKKRRKSIEARNIIALKEEINMAKKRLKISDNSKIYSCYEAGRDGFWIHRCLTDLGLINLVVDSASIEVSRRSRRAKTDRIDAGKLYEMLVRYLNGERKAWSVLHIPSVEDEDARRIHREIKRLKKERTSHTNRIKSLLVLHGIQLGVGRDFLSKLDKVKLWDQSELPPLVKREIIREHKRFELMKKQLKKLEDEKARILEGKNVQVKKVKALQNLKGIGPVSSWDLVFEYLGWREFKNVKQVGAGAGLAPTPHSSGDLERELGISKCGNRRVRSLMVELSWYWIRYQPDSHLSQWFMRRFGNGGKRMRRIGIVATARKLLIALWKYLEQGLVPEGARLKKLV